MHEVIRRPTRQDKGARTRQRIMATAELLVLRRGFAGTSLDDILRSVGTTKGAFFHHFGSKSDLGLALIERYRTTHTNLFARFGAEADALASDPLERMLLFLRRFEAYASAHKAPMVGCIYAAFASELDHCSQPMREAVAAGLEAWVRLYETCLDAILAERTPTAPVSARGLAEMIVALIEGALILSRSTGDVHFVARQSAQFRTYLGLLFASAPRAS